MIIKKIIRFVFVGIISVVMSAAYLGTPSARAAVGPDMLGITGGGCCGLQATNLTKAGSVLFFTDYDSINGTELWKSDGTASSTVIVKDINPGVGDSNPNGLTDIGGTLYFSATDGTHGTELWKSDGTASSTVMIMDINPGVGDSNPGNLTDVNGTLYFSATDGTRGTELWKSDGTATGTVMIVDINPSGDSSPQYLTYCKSTLFFIATDGTGSTIWHTDGTSDGTASTTIPAMSSPNNLFCAGDTLYFTANNFGGNIGVELGKTDGTGLGTVIVKDIDPGGDSSYPGNFADIGGVLYFSATDGSHGVEPWKSDGTASSTVMIMDINPGVGDSNPAQFFNNGGGTVYFDATDGSHGTELWKSDGTASGTVMVKDINPDGGDSWPAGFTDMYGKTYFDATNVSGGKGGGNKYQLWQTDGTESGTVAVADLNPGGDDSVSSLTKINNTLFFTADDGVNGTQLWIYGPSAPSVIATVITSAASSISTSALTLNASITDNGRADAIESGFAYGTVADLGTTIATSTLGAQTGMASFLEGLTGLTPNTIYYFRAYTVNSAGTSTGVILSATTLPIVAPPIIPIPPNPIMSSGNSTNRSGGFIYLSPVNPNAAVTPRLPETGSLPAIQSPSAKPLKVESNPPLFDVSSEPIQSAQHNPVSSITLMTVLEITVSALALLVIRRIKTYAIKRYNGNDH